MKLQTISSELDGVTDAVLHNLQKFWDYLIHDEGFFLFSSDVARYIFIATSVLLVLVMALARPRNLLDISLTLREAALSGILIVAMFARWYEYVLPQWFIFLELLAVSVIGVVLIWALGKEYLWTYIERRRTK